MPEYYEIFAHSDAITSLTMNHDNSLLLSGSEDGTIFLFKVIVYNINPLFRLKKLLPNRQINYILIQKNKIIWLQQK